MKKNYEDVTLIFINKSRKMGRIKKYSNGESFYYQGRKYFIDGKRVQVDYRIEETEIAKWITKNLKYNVRMLPRINIPEYVQTPDFIFNRERWDLKTIKGSSNQTLYHAVYRKKKQSNNFIFDITCSILNIHDVLKQIEILYRRLDTKFIDKIIIKDKDKFIILKRNKK